MSEFYPGQEVVCVDDSDRGDRPHLVVGLFIKRGSHYFVSRVGLHTYVDDGEVQSLWIEGVQRAFGVCRFRPVRPESIAIFRQMCVSNSPLVKVD